MKEHSSSKVTAKPVRGAAPVIAAVILIAALFAAVTSTFAFAATPFAATFDFDTGVPVLSTFQSTPLNQTSGLVNAYFNSTSDPAAFSVQSDATTSYKLSQFSGKYLWDNKASRDSIDIRFNVLLNNITFVFATIEFEGGPTSEPSNITLTAYMDSTASVPIGSTKSRGTWPSGDSYPQGNLTFASGSQLFNLVRIELLFQGVSAATDFMVDNITVAGPDIIPEFPTATVLATSMLIATLSVFIANKRILKHPKI
jgi:hypothetical protein